MRSEDWYAAVEERLAAVEAKLAPAAAPSVTCQVPGCRMPEFLFSVVHDPRMPGSHPFAAGVVPEAEVVILPSLEAALEEAARRLEIEYVPPAAVVCPIDGPNCRVEHGPPVMTVDHVRAISEYMRKAAEPWNPADPFGVGELKAQNEILQDKIVRQGDEIAILRAALGPGRIWHLVPEFPLSGTGSGWEPCMNQSMGHEEWEHEWRKD